MQKTQKHKKAHLVCVTHDVSFWSRNLPVSASIPKTGSIHKCLWIPFTLLKVHVHKMHIRNERTKNLYHYIVRGFV